MSRSLLVGGGAVGDGGGDAGNDAIEHEADYADIDEGQDDLADMRGVPRVPDEQADADAQPGEDIGGGRRHHDLPEELEVIEPQHLRHVAVVLRNVADTDRGVDDDWPDRGDEDDEDRGGLAVAEGGERERQPR